MRTELLKKAATNTFIYALGGIVGRVAGFFLIPVYARYLRPADYGTLELLDLTGNVVGMFAGVGLGAAMVRYYHDFKEEHERNETVSTAVLFGLGVNAAFLLILYQLSGIASRLVFGADAGYEYFFKLIFTSMALGIMAQVLLSYLRAKERSIEYTWYSILQLVLGLGLNIYFIAGRGMGIAGALYSSVITQAVVAAVLAWRTLAEVKVGFSMAKARAMLEFGLPLAPSGLAIFVLNFADRFFLQKFSTLSVVGTYALGYKLGMSIQVLFSSPFFLFWFPYRYELAQKAEAKELFSQVFEYLCLGLIFLTLGVSLAARDAVRILAPRDYWAASGIVPIIAVSYLFSSCYYYFQIGMGVTKQTRQQAVAVSTSAVACLFFYGLLIPRYEANGAAWATLLSFLLLAILTYRFSQRLYPIPYRFERCLKAAALAATVFLVSLLIPLGSLLLDIALRGLLLAAFPILLWATQMLADEEKLFLRRAFGDAAARLGLAGK